MSYKLNRTGAQIDDIFDKVDTIFFATYGTTTYAEITTAISGGKRVFLFKGAQLYAYKGVDAVNSAYVFGQLQGTIDQPAAGFAYCTTGSSWGTEDVPLATLQQYYESLMEDEVSAPIASFPDGADDVPVSKLTAYINPLQNLHGYANPWPEGGGKNKWGGGDKSFTYTETVNFDLPAGTYIASAVTTTTASTNYTCIIFYDSDNNDIGRFTFTANSGSRVSASSSLTLSVAAVKVILQAAATTATATGQTATFTDLQIEAGTTATTFAPYANICPISGYTGANIGVVGINQWDEEWEAGTIDVHGNNAANANTIRSKYYYACEDDRTLCFVKPVGKSCVIYWYDENKTFLSLHIATNDETAAANFNVTAPANTRYFRISVGSASTPYTTYGNDVSVNYPSSYTTYHAYNGTVYSVDWTDEGTVYHGTLSYLGNSTWKVVVDYAKKTFSGGDGWTASGTGYRYYNADVADGVFNSDTNVRSSYLPNKAYTADKPLFLQSGASNNHNIYVFNMNLVDASIVDAASFETYLSNNPLEVMYKLATPIEFTITGPDPATLLGENNIFTDTNGDVDVIYRANTALYIKKELEA